MYYADRYDAARQLLPLLEPFKNEDGLVLAIPRGGVPVGVVVAQYLQWPLDLLMTKKIGHPDNPEFAIGAVSLDDSLVEETAGVPESYIQEMTIRIREQLAERYRLFRGNAKPLPRRNKTLLVVDDGIATGRTILSTLRLLRSQSPARLIVAAPVASGQAAERIRRVTDVFCCPLVREDFRAVGNYYDDFPQVEDEEVIRLLQESAN